jgi:hypothetical protein
MDDLNFYLNYCFIRDDIDTVNFSIKQKACIERSRRNKKKEWVSQIARTITENRSEDLNLYISACMMNSNCDEFIDSLEPLFITFDPSMSSLLANSHTVCEDCCDLYTPCHLNDWADVNPELYDTEVSFFTQVITKFSDNIVIDLEPYSDEDIFPSKPLRRISTISHHNKLRQLYTVIIHNL